MFRSTLKIHQSLQNTFAGQRILVSPFCKILTLLSNNKIGIIDKKYSCSVENIHKEGMQPVKRYRRNPGYDNSTHFPYDDSYERTSGWFGGIMNYAGNRNNDHTYGSNPMRVTCGELRSHHVGCEVEIVGKVAKNNLGRFVLLKDGKGATQIVLPEHRTDLIKRFANLPLQSYVSIVGVVQLRPPNARNEKMDTGDVEVMMDKFLIVKVNQMPQINDFLKEKRFYSTLAHNPGMITSEEYKRCGDSECLKALLKARTVTCGTLDKSSVGERVELIGWMYRQCLPRFIHIKDGVGNIQCVLSNKPELQSVAVRIKPDSFVQVNGKVSLRPDSCINLTSDSGSIEIVVDDLTILDPKDPIPEILLQQTVEQTINVQEKVCETGVNSNCFRTHTCGDLRISNVNTPVKLCGWLEYRRMGKFLIMRDAYGVTQCIIPDEHSESLPKLDSIPLESVIEVHGLVMARPTNSANPEMPTGEIEVLVSELKILNSSTFQPFTVRLHQKAKEQLRLQYRYLDLRFPEMQRNLRLRSDMLMKMRKYLCDDHAFVEVETPTLFCRTPGGAQEFVVPTRHKGQFYSLVQSPQQFKQILMAGAIDRYFQVARCYRDETIRSDRQPEFTQLDVEMSFVGREDILSLMEGLLRNCWPRSLPDSIPRLTYKEALENYGSDKPDISYDLQIQNITDILRMCKEDASPSEDYIGSAILRKELNVSNSLRRTLQECTKIYPKVKCYFSQINPTLDSWFGSNLNTQIQEESLREIAETLQVGPRDFLILAYGPWEDTCLCMGDIRSMMCKNAESLNISQNNKTLDHPLWVVDFPLFVKSEDGSLQSCHHPFTAPNPEDEHLLDTEPLKVRSLAYDLVLNGNEVGGGSVRAHNPEMQKRLLNILNLSEKPLEHLLQALSSGCPPHGGIALGLDRLVSLACGADSIRDVIAFPKSIEGRDLLSGAPSTISEEEKQIYHIQVNDK